VKNNGSLTARLQIRVQLTYFSLFTFLLNFLLFKKIYVNLSLFFPFKLIFIKILSVYGL